MESSEPRPAPASQRPTAPAEPPLTALEALVICGVLIAATAACWLLYGPLIRRMIALI